MSQLRISAAAGLLGVSDDTVRRWIDSGRVDTVHGSTPQLIDGASLARLALELGDASPADPGELSPTSARNHFPGVVTRVIKDSVMAQVEVQAGAFRVVSLISAEAVADLGLEVGVVTTATVKATNVILERSAQ